MWFCMLATNYVVRLQVIMGMVDGLTTLCGCSVHPVGVLFVNWQSSITDLLYVCDLFLCLFLWNWSEIWLMLYLDWLQALPAWFICDKGDEFHRFVPLECGTWGRVWPARLFVSGELLKPRVMFSGGWKTFAISNDLRAGDRLIFFLKVVSEFVVAIFRRAATTKRMFTRAINTSRANSGPATRRIIYCETRNKVSNGHLN